MKKIDELVNEFEKICMEFFYDDEYKKYNSSANKLDKIFKYIELNKLEKEFTDKIFKSKEPYVLWLSANKAFDRNYDLHKAYDVIKYIIENVDNLVFCDDKERNESERNSIKKDGLSRFEEEIEFYESIGDDYLYNAYCKFPLDIFNLYSEDKKTNEIHLNLDVLNKNLDLLKELEKKGYIDRLFNIILERMRHKNDFLSFLEDFYIFAKYNYKKDYTILKLKEELERNPSRLNKCTKSIVTFFLNDLL